jgi:hypothetical protein
MAVCIHEAVGAFAARPASAADAILHILNADALFRALRQVDHPRTLQRDDGLFGIVVQVLADDEHRLAAAIALGVRESDAGREGNIAGHFLPEIAELVLRVPYVVARGVDGVLPSSRVETGAANVRLTLKPADGASQFLLGWWNSGGGATWVWVAEPGCAHAGAPVAGAAGADVAGVCALSPCGAAHSSKTINAGMSIAMLTAMAPVPPKRIAWEFVLRFRARMRPSRSPAFGLRSNTIGRGPAR